MNITEHIALDAASVRHKDANGFLHIDTSHITKEQVCGYMGSEIGAVDGVQIEPSKMYYGYRPGKELEKAADTFNGIPILFEHHMESAENPCKEFRVGSTGTDAAYNAPYLDNSLHITDSVAIAAIESGEYRELSCAYAFVMDWSAGEFEGEKYDFIMRDIKGNHVALVQEGRAGHDVRAADAAIKTAAEPQKGDEKPMDKLLELLKQAVEMAEANNSCDTEPKPEPVAQGTEPEAVGADHDLETLLAAIGKEEVAKVLKAHLAMKAGAPEEKPETEDSECAENTDSEEAEKKTEAQPPAQPAADSAAVMRKAAELAEKRVREDMKAKFAAAQDCAPLVGTINNPFEYESAEAIYKTALDAKGIDTKKHPVSAYKSMVEMLKAAEAPRMNADSAFTLSDTGTENKAFDNLKNIRRG